LNGGRIYHVPFRQVEAKELFSSKCVLQCPAQLTFTTGDYDTHQRLLVL